MIYALLLFLGVTLAYPLMKRNSCLYVLNQEGVTQNKIIFWFGMLPQQVLTKYYIWQLFTYMFLHGDFLHILLNMFILWMFGCEIERNLGFKEFLKYYTVCGIGGACGEYRV